jgi:RNA polymerase sigma factor (sigma-70 family)
MEQWMTQLEPDIGALYLAYKDAMYRVAGRVLREVGLEAEAEDVVSVVITSVLHSRPTGVENWEAFLVRATRNRAIDKLRSAAVRHAGPELGPEHDLPDDHDLGEDVADLVDAQSRAHRVRVSVASLDPRLQTVAWEYIGKERPRQEIAAELGVSPGRVSQMAKQVLELLRETISREEVL